MNKHQTIEQFPINKLESDSTIESLQQENAALKEQLKQVRRETLEEAADWFVRKDSYAWENLTRMAGEQHE